MAKFVAMSVVLAMVAIPAWAARERNPRRALKKALFFVVGFNLFYLIAVGFLIPRYTQP